MNLDDLEVARSNGMTIKCSYCGEDKINRGGWVRVIGHIVSSVDSATQQDHRVICTDCEIKAMDSIAKPKAEPKAPAKKAPAKKNE